MYNRFLFIGLGGSGGKTLRFLKDQIRRWMHEHGIEGDIPAGWQFLHVDTPLKADGDEINDRVPHLAGGEYLGLVPAGIDFTAVQGRLDGLADRRAELRTWRVEPTNLKIPILAGAGQYRAIGHTIGTLYVNGLKAGIGKRLAVLNTAAAKNQLSQTYARVHGTGTAAPGDMPTYVFVISSLAGGTGAGLISTVCDLIRCQDQTAGSTLFGILYTSEVFNVLQPAARAGVHGNGLAAVCEMLNGYWWGGDLGTDDGIVVGPIDDPFLSAAGAVRPLEFSGPAYPFLVGLKNAAGVNFGTFDALFEGVGRALLSWVTSEEVAGSFISYTIANFTSAADAAIKGKGEALVDVGEPAAIGRPPFSALGFARVSLGTDHFERYAVDRVVRDTYEHLANYHFRSDEASRLRREISNADPDTLAGNLAAGHAGWFRGEVGLEEEERGVDPILAALSPPAGSIDRMAERCREYQRQIEQAAALDVGAARPAGEWRGLVDDAVEDCFGDYAKQVRAEVDERSREWVEAIEERARSAVEAAIKRYGLRVTARLCADLANDLRTSFVERLRGVSEDCRYWSGGWQNEAAQHLDTARGRLAADHQSLRDYLEAATHHRSFELDALVADRAAELAAEAADKLFDPLSAAIEDAHGRLRGESGSDGLDFGPPENEFSLIDAAEHRALFDRLLGRTFGSGDYGKLREAVIGCDACDQRSEDRFINIARSWAPGARWSGAPTNLSVTVCRTREGSTRELLVRSATAWLRDEGRPFGQLLGLGLRDALDTAGTDDAGVTATERQEYQQKFLARLGTAVDRAAPLVDLDPDLAGLVGADAGTGLVRHLSKLPFGPGKDGEHPMQKLVEGILAQKIDPDTLKDLMNDDPRTTHIDIATQLAAPQSVLAMKSLLAPIAEDWGRQQGNGPVAMQQFWKHRRARPLQRFVPVPQAHLRCLVRGWFTAGMLGLLDTSAADGTILIARDNGRDPVRFPNPALSPISRRDRLGPVLEALGLAYVEVAKRRSLEPLEAYVQLRNLGTSADRGILHYDGVNRRLAQWIETGRPDPHALGDMNPRHLSDAANTENRVAELAGAIHELDSGYRTEYDDLANQWDQASGKLSTAPLWTGLWPLIGEELQKLHRAVKSHKPDDGLR